MNDLDRFYQNTIPENWIVWCSETSFPLGALSDKAGKIEYERRAGRKGL